MEVEFCYFLEEFPSKTSTNRSSVFGSLGALRFERYQFGADTRARSRGKAAPKNSAVPLVCLHPM